MKSEMEYALELNDVTKKFNGRSALENVSFSVPSDSIYGIIGRNGSGKTTLIRLILGFLRPCRGSIQIMGRQYGASCTKIGYLPEFPDYHLLFTGREYLTYLAGLCGMAGSSAAAKVSELLEATGMTGAAERRMAHYSKGMLQKIGIAQALISSSELVILDEPFSGLDPFAQKELCDIIAGLRAFNKTVLICSHILAHLEKICGSVALIHGGHIIRQGQTSSLLRKRNNYIFDIEIADTKTLDSICREYGLGAAQGGVFVMSEKTPGDKEKVLKRLIESNARINAFYEVRESLDDYFNAAVAGEAH